MIKNGEVHYYSVSGNFEPIPELGAITKQCVMPILSIADGHLVAHGTGFIITAHGIMMTAKHVIEDAWSHRIRKINEQGQFYDHYELYALYQANERHPDDETLHIGGLIPINRIWAIPNLDIVYCWLSPLIRVRDDEPLRFPQLCLSPGIPKIGERIMGIGYYRMKGSEIRQHELENLLVEYSQESAHSAGRVIELFPDKRDSGMLNFPCFQTDARFDHGMSGGPVFNEAGHVCGVICSSTTQVEGDPGYISHVSLIWPAMGIQIEVAGEGGKSEMRFVYELARNGLIATDDTINDLRIHIGPDNKCSIYRKHKV